jgi:hypothetical protein
LDFVFRRKKWTDNTKPEKISLILNMLLVSIYIFGSFLGLLWGVTDSGADTAFGEVLYDVTLVILSFNWLIGVVATIGAFILRKLGKTKASIWINVLSLGYMVLLFVINSLTEFF